MRRLLTTLFILLVVLVAGITALVALINPNDFRNYMIAKVEQRSGYRLSLEGDLRWHAWPQLSMLAGRMTLTAPGAKVPLVTAENMRLDVALWPLVSHQLSVKQVMLKGAVINITPDSEARRPEHAPIAPAGTPETEDDAGWSWNIASLRVADSLLIWQRDANEQINLRDLNLSMDQNAQRQASIEFSSRVNRDQRDVSLSLKGNVDLSHYPRQVSASLDKFNYRLQGNGLPPQGITGDGSFNADYSRTNQTIELSNLRLSANDSLLTGQASATLGQMAHYQLDLNAKNLNLDTLTGFTPAEDNAGEQQAQSASSGRPVIASPVPASQPLSALNDFNAQLNLSAEQVIYHGLQITDFKTQADNRHGHLVLNNLSGKLGEGTFNVPGTVDVTTPQSSFILQPRLQRVELGPLLKAFALPQTLTGQLSVEGQLTGATFSYEDFARSWQGKGALTLDNARLEGLNISQLIQRAVARSSSNVAAEDRSERYSQVQQLSAKGILNHGNLQLNDLQGSSDLLALSGNGSLDLPGRQCDVNLNIRVLKGWQGDAELVNALTSTPIPLRVYGPWDGLSYQLHVDQLIRNRLEDEVKKRLGDWQQKNQGKAQNKNVQQLMNKL